MNLTQAFKTLQSELTKLKTKAQRDKLKKIAFKMMEDPDAATKGKGTSVHLLIGKAAKREGNMKLKPKPKPHAPDTGDLDPLLTPLDDSSESSDSEDDTDSIDIDSIDADELTDLILDIDKIEVDRQKAKNEKKYGEKQLKAAVTSLDNILGNWENIEKKGLKKLVNKALSRLNKIKEKL
jgi:hypothetical protein